MKHKRVYRLYQEDGLSLRLKRPRRNVSAANRERQPAASAPNEMWSMDFVSDALFDGRRLPALTVVDAFTREALAVDVDEGIKGEQVVATMTRISAIRGAPKTIRVDNVLGHEGKRDLVNRSLCADIERRGMHSEPDGFHRQRDRSLP